MSFLCTSLAAITEMETCQGSLTPREDIALIETWEKTSEVGFVLGSTDAGPSNVLPDQPMMEETMADPIPSQQSE